MGIEPSQTIRLPMHEAIEIIMELLSKFSGFPHVAKNESCVRKIRIQHAALAGKIIAW
jgi:hypothetical protein